MNIATAKILTIDDEPLLLRSVQVRLRMAGFYNVESVSDPWKAKDIILENQPDLILLDLLMPELTGMELLDTISKMESPPTVVVLSAADMDMKYQALEMGAFDFINKPIDSNELRVRVINALRQDEKLAAR